ncbi:hypothetical protein [Cyclobacterium qasimii]|uniref:Outer membrane protein beta-barrel domain-containing protein n=2 Tax=Cyclobacterium qasimii TaxID=1350429 RepID=S7V5G5_9BACT|nr:hypothetical protein [Cyclobacterium qasimii]EPR65116.1 hypothetical protein ADICYQ_5887 [Cyclobacterium qasimii M12-11B]GEO22757.1 hypothetical protein CQA01_32910 [Cyclobacterium qasimii]
MKNSFITSFFVVLLTTGLFITSANGQNFYKEKVPRNSFLQAGVGLGTIYADNAGGVRNLTLLLRPGLSFTYGKKIHKHWDVRANIGYQRYKSQDASYYGPTIVQTWIARDQAVTSKNNLLFLDVIPSFYLFSSENHTRRSKINVYGGAGIGLLMNSNQTTKIDFNGTSNHKDTQLTGYIPLKGGLSYRLDIYTDIAFEGTLMLTFSDNLDGNEGYNRLNDHPMIGQIVIRRYLNPFKSIY